MMRSMFSAVSGLSSHQAKMDVIGNNIANVNTVGYKAGRVTFADSFNQTLKGASSGQNGRGGQNPMQIGLGINVGAIETIHTRGAVERTDVPTDLMINGEGFFIVSGDANYASRLYTRAGNFNIDKLGNLLTSDGYSILGYRVDKSTIGMEEVTYENELKGLVIDKTQTFPAKGTGISFDGTDFPPPSFTGVNFDGNLNAKTKIIDDPTTLAPSIALKDIEPKEAIARDTTFTVYDELGGEHQVRMVFIKEAANIWRIGIVDGNGVIEEIVADPLEFDPTTGKPKSGDTVILNAMQVAGTPTTPFDNGASAFSFEVDLSKLTQYDNDSDASATNVVGYKSGSFDSADIGPDGVITVTYSNGMKAPIGQIALAKFRNPAGLVKTQGNMFDVSPNSGNPMIGKPAEAGFANLSPGSLEMSNVDLSKEFTNMIVTQRGFQANSRIITVTDEMLQELANLKR